MSHTETKRGVLLSEGTHHECAGLFPVHEPLGDGTRSQDLIAVVWTQLNRTNVSHNTCRNTIVPDNHIWSIKAEVFTMDYG